MDFSNIAVGATIVGILDLLIVVLVKTETILKYVEKIKQPLRLDYRSRAKRADDEIRILGKHKALARERVRHTFISMRLWHSQWIWDWSDDLEPIDIKGYCTGWEDSNGTTLLECGHPVFIAFAQGPADELQGFEHVGIYCSRGEDDTLHRRGRDYFEVPTPDEKTFTASEIVEELLRKAIIAERDLRIAAEVRKLGLQFWR